MTHARHDVEGLVARVERLESIVGALRAQLAAATGRAPPPTDPDLGVVPPPEAAPDVVAAIASVDPIDRVVAPSPVRSAHPAQAAPRDDGLELAIGTFWLSRIGIVALVTGIAWFIAIHFGDMSPVLRVLVGYGIAAAITASGAWLAVRHRLLGHVVLGGGLAVGYVVTYALHFIAPMRMIESPLAALVLLAMVLAAIVAVGQRLRSETVVGAALVLGFHAGFAFDIRLFTLLSTTVLALAAAYVFVHNRWVYVPLSTMLAVYARHAIASERALARGDGPLALAFLVLYFVVFAGAALTRPASPHPRWRGDAATLSVAIGNVALFSTLAIAAAVDRPEWLLPVLVVGALLFLGAACVAWRRGARLLVEIHAAAAVPVVAGIFAAVWPAPAAAAVIAVAGTIAVGWSVRTKRVAVAAASTLTLVAAMGAFAVQSEEAVFGPVVFGFAFVACTRLWRDVPDLHVAGAMRPLAATGAAVGLLLADRALLERPYETLGGVVVAVALVATGIAWRERALRFAGLAVLALAAGKLLLVDLARLPTDQRILTFVATGAILLALSYAYTRFRGSLGRVL